MLNDKMLAVINEICDEVAEREELTEAIAIALLTRKNLFVLGDTGQAKSEVINHFRKRITGARQFERLMSKQADEEQLFGRIDLSSLIPGYADPEALLEEQNYHDLMNELYSIDRVNNDLSTCLAKEKRILDELDIVQRKVSATARSKPRLITDGKIPDSHIVFLDEIFKANDGILNALLTALNERKFTNEGETVDIPVISFFAASNEIPNFNNPEESILKPLYDRLELKLMTEYVKKRDARLDVLKKKQAKIGGRIANTITLNELYAMQAEVDSVIIPDSINELMDDIVCELRDKGVHISDRKYFNYYPLAQAFAWLCGKSEVTSIDLLILRHCLWTNPAERTVINEVLERKCVNPLKEDLDNIRAMALECFNDFEDSAITDGSSDGRRIGKLRSEFIELYKTLRNLKANAQGSELQQIEDAIRGLEEFSSRAHTSTSYTYVPLNELYSIG